MNATERLRAAVDASDERIATLERLSTEFNNELVINTIISVFSYATNLLNESSDAGIMYLDMKFRGSKKVDILHIAMADHRVQDIFRALVDNSFEVSFQRGNVWAVEMDIPKRYFRFYHEAPELEGVNTYDDYLRLLQRE
jgi:hypothetical protein